MQNAPTARNAFIDSLVDAGGRSYFAGHVHFYNHLRADDADGNLGNDLHQFIVGTAGAPLRGEGLVYSVPEAATALLHTFALLTLALLRRRARSG